MINIKKTYKIIIIFVYVLLLNGCSNILKTEDINYDENIPINQYTEEEIDKKVEEIEEKTNEEIDDYIYNVIMNQFSDHQIEMEDTMNAIQESTKYINTNKINEYIDKINLNKESIKGKKTILSKEYMNIKNNDLKMAAFKIINYYDSVISFLESYVYSVKNLDSNRLESSYNMAEKSKQMLIESQEYLIKYEENLND